MINKIKRIVVKIGSSSLTYDSGKPDYEQIKHFVQQLVELKDDKKEVILVTSGAIGAGMAELGVVERPSSIPEQQGMAAVGQALLMEIYNRILRKHKKKGAQILLTSSDLENRTRYINAYNTLDNLLKKDILPIINENDTVATQEIKFGDNDTLAARVAGLVEADLLIILSDVEGLYNGRPDSGESKLKIINKVEEITPGIIKIAGGNGSKLGTGGMATKIKAARISINSGIPMVIGPGYRKNVIKSIVKMMEMDSEYIIGTTFLPNKACLSKRKHWLYYNLSICGKVFIDCGAEKALVSQGKSLLPGGVAGVKGKFQEGELVSIVNKEGEELGRGLVNYTSEEIKIIKGHHSKEIKSLLGFINRVEIIHRDNMVITKGDEKDEY